MKGKKTNMEEEEESSSLYQQKLWTVLIDPTWWRQPVNYPIRGGHREKSKQTQQLSDSGEFKVRIRSSYTREETWRCVNNLQMNLIICFCLLLSLIRINKLKIKFSFVSFVIFSLEYCDDIFPCCRQTCLKLCRRHKVLLLWQQLTA